MRSYHHSSVLGKRETKQGRDWETDLPSCPHYTDEETKGRMVFQGHLKQSLRSDKVRRELSRKERAHHPKGWTKPTDLGRTGPRPIIECWAGNIYTQATESPDGSFCLLIKLKVPAWHPRPSAAWLLSESLAEFLPSRHHSLALYCSMKMPGSSGQPPPQPRMPSIFIHWPSKPYPSFKVSHKHHCMCHLMVTATNYFCNLCLYTCTPWYFAWNL